MMAEEVETWKSVVEVYSSLFFYLGCGGGGGGDDGGGFGKLGET
jgi:D-serine dehydratase